MCIELHSVCIEHACSVYMLARQSVCILHLHCKSSLSVMERMVLEWHLLPSIT